MKTSLKKNKKIWAATLALLLSLSCLLGIWTVVYAQEKRTADTPTSDKTVQTEVEVNVKYIFDDETVYKEEKIKAEKGQLLDSGDLPMLPDEMKFIDEFLFYEVKGDGTDEIIRKVAKIEMKDEEKQTGEENPKEDEGTQTETPKTEDKETQTELSKDNIAKMEKEAKELQDKLDKLNSEMKDKEKLSDEQKEKIKDLEAQIESLKEKMKKDKKNKDLSEDMKKEMDRLTEKIKELEKKEAETNKAPITSNPITPISPITGNKTGSDSSNQSAVSNIGKGTTTLTSSKNTVKDTSSSETKEKEKDIRYPNKLTPKSPDNNSSQDSSMDTADKSVNTNKGVASVPSKARGTVTENKDNGNKDYPIHHGDETDANASDMYSADARQFITFQTKNGKTFHLIINHDETQENVMLLTEVSEDDLLNMVEKKEEPKKEEIVPQKEVEEPKETPKKEQEKKSDLGTYILLALVVVGALGGGYYFKVVKNKEKQELENLEEEDDFFAEAEEDEESEASEKEDI